jgi:hypothetical protein
MTEKSVVSHSLRVFGRFSGGLTVNWVQPWVVAAVIVRGPAPVLTIVIICGWDGVTEASFVQLLVVVDMPVIGFVVVVSINVAGLNFAENVANAAGTTVRIGVAGGLTTRPFFKVSVQPVVALVYVTSNGVGTGAVPPTVQVCVSNLRPVVGTDAVNVVRPVVASTAVLEIDKLVSPRFRRG